MKTLYEQDQMAWVILACMALPSLIIPAIYVAMPKEPELTMVLWITFALMVLLCFLFYKGRIVLTAERVRFSFGPGLISKSISLNDIVSCKPATLTILNGYGIHWSNQGWFYNVSGNEAVAFELRSGKTIRFGTDEPARLCAAVNRALEDIKERDDA